MFEWFKNSFVFLNRLYTLMKKVNTPAEIPASKSKVEKSTATEATKKTPEKSTATKVTKTTTEKTSPKPKPAKKAPVVDTKPIASSSVISMNERVGLTAGSIWHYLTGNGETSVAKLVDALPEEELIQRSIGWLAQEDKITLSVVDQIETIALKG